MRIQQIPSWDSAQDRMECGEPTPLDVFIFHNEPAGIEESRIFRKQLLDAINNCCLVTR